MGRTLLAIPCLQRTAPRCTAHGMTAQSVMTSDTEISGLLARQLASHLLTAVLRNKQPFDDAFAASSAKAAFSGLAFRDRAFARAIAATALRRLGQIEDMLGRFLEKPLPADAFEARFILIAGAVQLAFMEVAPHAAIGLAVEQAKGTRAARHLAGLVNAVLRRVNAAQGCNSRGARRKQAQHAGNGCGGGGSGIMAKTPRAGSRPRIWKSRRWICP